MKLNWKLLRIALFIGLITVCLFAAVSCSSGPYETEISRARLNGDHISVTATLDPTYISEHRNETVYLLAVPSAYTDALSDYIVVGNSTVREKMDFEFPADYEGESLLAYAFVLASGEVQSGNYQYANLTSLTAPKYVENADNWAYNHKSATDTNTIKGIQTNDYYEAEFLGAQHILFEADMAKLLLSDYSENAINHTYNGLSYYFDREAVELLDKEIEQASKLNMRIYLRTILGDCDRQTENGEFFWKILYCSGAARGKAGYLPNMESREAVGYVGAFYDFLAARYLNDDTTLLDFVIGDSVNNYSEYCNAGSCDAEKFKTLYFSWLRAAYNVLTSHSSNACVYAAIDNNWRLDQGSAIGSRTFLTQLTGISQKIGDFPWQVAFNLGSGNDLSNLLSGESAGYSVLGVNEFVEITALLEKEEMLYDSSSRRVIIDGLVLPTSLSESNRAAYYTYAYYKTAEAGFDAIIYNASLPDSTMKNSKNIRSAFYFSFLMCGSSLTAQLNDYVGKIPNSKLPAFSDYTTRHLVYEQSVVREISDNILRNKTEFPYDYHDFAVGGSAYNADISYFVNADGNKDKILTLSTNSTGNFGAVTLYDVPAKDIIEYGYIGIKMSSVGADKAILIITDKYSKNDAASYVGEAEISAETGMYYFKISSFTDNIRSSDTLNISICVSSDDAAFDSSLSIEEISLYGSSGNGGNTLVTILIVAGSIAGICLLLFLLSKRRKKHLYEYEEEAVD